MTEKTNEKDFSAGLIHQAIPDVEGTEPRLNTGIPRIPNVWENAAIAAGRVPDDPIVGHTTFRDGHHEPLRQSEAEAIIAASDRAKALRAEQMPDERSAIEAMFSAWLRLKELGWNEAIYCPKDGTWFSSIESGSTGIHRTQYQGKWPDGTWWIADDDLWPSRPCLWKPIDSGNQVTDAERADSTRRSAAK